MKKILLTIILIIPFSNALGVEEVFKYMGSYDNVKSTDTGHCYGASVLIWEKNNKNIVGLLNIDMGLCGDPPCSILNGTIDNDKLKFITSVPIYNELYSFDGKITKTALSGLLNGSSATLKNSSLDLPYNNIDEWCSAWSQVQRCGGVKEFCK